MTAVRIRAGALLAVLALGACGGSGTDLSSGAERVLGADVAAVTAAARAGSAPRLATALGTLRRDVAEQQAAGHLSADRARRILAAGSRVEADVQTAARTRPSAAPRTPTAVPTRTPTATRAPSAPAAGRAPAKNKGKGKGGEDDGGDD
jgi:hypothetical protein